MSVVSPTSYLFSKFPVFLGDDHEPCMVPLESLIAAFSISNDKTSIKMDGDSMVITTPRKGETELAMKPATDSLSVAPTIEQPTLEFVLTKDIQDFFKQLLPVLGMEKIHAAQPDFRLFVEVGKKVFVAVYSPMQIVCASMSNPGFGFEGSFNVPYPVFTAIVKNIPEPDCRITFSDDQILVTSESGDSHYSLLTLTAPLSSKEPPGDLVKERSRDIVKMSTEKPTVEIPKDSIKAFLEHSKGVLVDETPVTFEPIEGGLSLNGSTVSSKSVFKIKIPGNNLQERFSLELKFLRNLLAKSGETMELTIFDNILLMRSGTLNVITTTYSDI